MRITIGLSNRIKWDKKENKPALNRSKDEIASPLKSVREEKLTLKTEKAARARHKAMSLYICGL